MKRTIQITTVREYADVQVIRLDAAFVAKAVQARFAAQRVNEAMTTEMYTGQPCDMDELLEQHALVGQFVEELYKAILPDEDDNSANENKPTDDLKGTDREGQDELDEHARRCEHYAKCDED